MKYEFLRPAEDEFEEAVRYYNRRQRGLGNRFMKEVRKTISRITDFPEAWTPVSPGARRCLADRFPYGIIYQIRDDKILILAVMHLSRKPDYRKNRL
jgi:plasmid stabilization system protein ParE